MCVGCWMLGVGCWVLDVGCWMLGVGCWVLDVGCWMLDVRCWMFGVRCWVFGAKRGLAPGAAPSRRRLTCTNPADAPQNLFGKCGGAGVSPAFGASRPPCFRGR